MATRKLNSIADLILELDAHMQHQILHEIRSGAPNGATGSLALESARDLLACAFPNAMNKETERG